MYLFYFPNEPIRIKQTKNLRDYILHSGTILFILQHHSITLYPWFLSRLVDFSKCRFRHILMYISLSLHKILASMTLCSSYGWIIFTEWLCKNTLPSPMGILALGCLVIKLRRTAFISALSCGNESDCLCCALFCFPGVN